MLQTAPWTPENVEIDGDRVQDQNDARFWHSLRSVKAEPSRIEAALTQGFPGLMDALQPTRASRTTTTILGSLGSIGCEIKQTWQQQVRRTRQRRNDDKNLMHGFGFESEEYHQMLEVLFTYELVDRGSSYVRYKRTHKIYGDCDTYTDVTVDRTNETPIFTYEWFPNPNGEGQVLHIIDDLNVGQKPADSIEVTKMSWSAACWKAFPCCCFAPMYRAWTNSTSTMFKQFREQQYQKMREELDEQLRTTVKYLETYKEPAVAVQDQPEGTTHDMGAAVQRQPEGTARAVNAVAINFCGKCGRPSVTEDAFCKGCGAKL